MRCNNCGKKVQEGEFICPQCGNYIIEEWTEESPKNIEEKQELKEEKKPKVKQREKVEIEEFRVKDASGTKKNEFFYENEDLLEAYIGEDYKLIKKSPFNFWAFLFNWVYLLYRKLYITGIIGLIITWLLIILLRNYKYLLVYAGIVSIVLGFTFSKYYISIAKKRVEKIKAQEESEEEGIDKFTLAGICKERGGVNVPKALIIYLGFLVITFLCLFPISINMHHNEKFWKENSENLANCSSLVKTAYNNVLTDNEIGTVEEALCRVIKKNSKEYEIYVKTKKNSQTIYSCYATEKGYIFLKNRTTNLDVLLLEKSNGTLTEDQAQLLQELENIQKDYQTYYQKSQEEDKLILKKKNKEEKLNYIFTKEEIIR